MELIRRELARERWPIPDWAIFAVVFVVAFVAVALRRPDAIAYAQFFAEDGAKWYSEAHDLGAWQALSSTYRGYFHTLPRLAAFASLAVPLLRAPLVMNAIAIAVEALPAAFVCTSRLSRPIPRVWARVLLAAFYVALPNVWGTMANVTNSQWYLAILACAVVLAVPSERIGWRAFDVGAVAISGLSGPFSLFLLPIAAVNWLVRRERWTLVLGAVLSAAAVVQVWAILIADPETGAKPELGASTVQFLRISVGRILYGVTLGQTGYERMFNDPGTVWLQAPALFVVGALLLALLAYALWRAPLELRLLIAFAMMGYASALIWPSNKLEQMTYWDALTGPGTSNRYFVLPMFALLAVFVWLACRRSYVERAVGVALLAVTAAFGVTRDYREPPLKDYDFARFVARYEQAASGEKIQILQPPGWSMLLTKP